MADTIEQIKNRLGIVDVVGSYIKLEKAGINFKSRCPFHNEKTPSFFVSPQRESFYCFGCGKKGDIFNFVQEFEGVDFLGSLKILAEKAGVEIQKIDPKIKDENEKLLSVLEEATSFFENELQKNKDALVYLKDRGLDEDSIKAFRLGYAKDEWRSLMDYLKGKGFDEKSMEAVGLIKESSGKKYDRFRSRIMFPVNDASGRVVAFSGRIFGKEENDLPKYINSPETKFFRKSDTLFGYDKAKLDIRRNDFAILVEGNFDCLMAHKAGYRNTLAPLGTSVTKEQIEKISKLTKRIVIAFDSDSAGFKASSRGSKIALSMGIDLKVASIPGGKDPADLILKSVEEWKKVIKDSKHIVEFYLEKLKRDETDKRKLGLKVKEEILPFVAMIDNKIDQAHFVKVLSESIDLPEESIYSEMEKINISELDVPYVKDGIKEGGDRDKNIIRKIASIILWQKGLENKTIDVKFAEKELVRITNNPEIFKNFNEGDKEDMLFEADIFYQELENIDTEIKEMLLRLEKNYLEEEFNKKSKELRKAEEEKNQELSLEILKECQNLSKQIEENKERIKELK